MRSDRDNHIYTELAQSGDRNGLEALWTECFPEDSEAFKDYYFNWYFSGNRVWLARDEDRIVSQIHMNPYTLAVGSESFDSFYIVGVSTAEACRHRGLMSTLLKRVIREAFDNKLPFIYLMPADSDIYRPFGFEYIYAREKMELKGIRGGSSSGIATGEYHFSGADILVRSASGEDYSALAKISNVLLAQENDIYTLRDEFYYERLQGENRADGGDLLILRHGSDIISHISYALEEYAQIREIAVREEYINILSDIIDKGLGGVKVEIFPLQSGFAKAFSPHCKNRNVASSVQDIIMGRIGNVKAFLELVGRQGKPGNEGSLIIDYEDDIIEENSGLWLWRYGGGESSAVKVKKDKLSFNMPVISLDCRGLIRWPTSYDSVEELKKRGSVIKDWDAFKTACKFPVINRVFINEIV